MQILGRGLAANGSRSMSVTSKQEPPAVDNREEFLRADRKGWSDGDFRL